MSYYKQFAEMLGLELDQDFILINADGKRKNEYIYKITEDGLLYKMPTQYTNWSNSSSGTIVKLLNGDYKALAKPWKPEREEKYWFYLYGSKQITYSKWEDGTYDLLLWKVGNCFKTREEAEIKGKEIMEHIKKEYDESIEKYMREELGL